MPSPNSPGEPNQPIEEASKNFRVMFAPREDTANNKTAINNSQIQSITASENISSDNNSNDFLSGIRNAHINFAMNVLQSKLAKTSPSQSISALIDFTRQSQLSFSTEYNDAITGLRNILTNRDDIEINHDGTIKNPLDPISVNSFSGNNFPKLKKNNIFFPFITEEELKYSDFHNSNPATQWYRNVNDNAAASEIDRMYKVVSDAQPGFLDNGLMYWVIRLNPIICGIRKPWTILAVYNNDYSKNKTNCRFYAIKPNFEEMTQLIKISRGEDIDDPQLLHLFRDPKNGQYLFGIEHTEKESHSCAKSSLLCIIYWINLFELSLIDYDTWRRFKCPNPLEPPASHPKAPKD